jgi:spore maturation protein CgeB
MTHQRGIEDILVPNEDVVSVASAAEAEVNIRALLADPVQAEAMAIRANAKIVGHHTWTQRGDQIVNICESELRDRQPGKR